MNDFFTGAKYVFRGCRSFYGDPAAWKYCIFPVCLMTALYVLLYIGVFIATGSLVEHLTGAAARLPEYLAWLEVCIRWGIWIGGTAAFFILLAGSVTMMYELIAGFFFDALADHYEKKTFGTTAVPFSWKGTLLFTAAAIRFALGTLVILMVLFPVNLFLPFIGQILTAFIMGYCLGISSMMSSAGRNGIPLAELREAARRRRLLVTGFGVTAYLLLLIPFVTLFLLPALVLGGAELRCRELS